MVVFIQSYYLEKLYDYFKAKAPSLKTCLIEDGATLEEALVDFNFMSVKILIEAPPETYKARLDDIEKKLTDLLPKGVNVQRIYFVFSKSPIHNFDAEGRVNLPLYTPGDQALSKVLHYKPPISIGYLPLNAAGLNYDQVFSHLSFRIQGERGKGLLLSYNVLSPLMTHDQVPKFRDYMFTHKGALTKDLFRLCVNKGPLDVLHLCHSLRDLEALNLTTCLDLLVFLRKRYPVIIVCLDPPHLGLSQELIHTLDKIYIDPGQTLAYTHRVREELKALIRPDQRTGGPPHDL